MICFSKRIVCLAACALMVGVLASGAVVEKIAVISEKENSGYNPEALSQRVYHIIRTRVGIEFDEKVLNRVISGLNDLYLKLPPVQGTTPCEVAVVSDRGSAWRTQFPAANTPNTIAAEALFHHFNELAVPFRSLTVDDLLDSAIAVPPHKCYVC